MQVPHHLRDTQVDNLFFKLSKKRSRKCFVFYFRFCGLHRRVMCFTSNDPALAIDLNQLTSKRKGDLESTAFHSTNMYNRNLRNESVGYDEMEEV